jgi:hypothetical protein
VNTNPEPSIRVGSGFTGQSKTKLKRLGHGLMLLLILPLRQRQRKKCWEHQLQVSISQTFYACGLQLKLSRLACWEQKVFFKWSTSATAHLIIFIKYRGHHWKAIQILYTSFITLSETSYNNMFLTIIKLFCNFIIIKFFTPLLFPLIFSKVPSIGSN